MDDKYKARLEEVAENIRITKRQIKRAKARKLSLPPGNHVICDSDGGMLCILEDQLRDLIIQQAHIKKEIEKEEQQK